MSVPESNYPAWLAKAENDFLNIENNLRASRVPWDTVCFHAQQAAEKLLKAFLVYHGRLRYGPMISWLYLHDVLNSKGTWKTWKGIAGSLPLMVSGPGIRMISLSRASKTPWKWSA